jgi:hypothetical protein
MGVAVPRRRAAVARTPRATGTAIPTAWWASRPVARPAPVIARPPAPLRVARRIGGRGAQTGGQRRNREAGGYHRGAGQTFCIHFACPLGLKRVITPTGPKLGSQTVWVLRPDCQPPVNEPRNGRGRNPPATRPKRDDQAKFSERHAATDPQAPARITPGNPRLPMGSSKTLDMHALPTKPACQDRFFGLPTRLRGRRRAALHAGLLTP